MAVLKVQPTQKDVKKVINSTAATDQTGGLMKVVTGLVVGGAKAVKGPLTETKQRLGEELSKLNNANKGKNIKKLGDDNAVITPQMKKK